MMTFCSAEECKPALVWPSLCRIVAVVACVAAVAVALAVAAITVADIAVAAIAVAVAVAVAVITCKKSILILLVQKDPHLNDALGGKTWLDLNWHPS